MILGTVLVVQQMKAIEFLVIMNKEENNTI
mgnify:CR=1 FL=1